MKQKKGKKILEKSTQAEFNDGRRLLYSIGAAKKKSGGGGFAFMWGTRKNVLFLLYSSLLSIVTHKITCKVSWHL